MDEWQFHALEDSSAIESVDLAGVPVRRGDQVRLRPKGRGDIFDLALSGQMATIEAIEHDYDGRVYLAVTIDADPGRDLGLLRQPGHRFFFSVDEVEPIG
jgi:hypothetical protein